MTNLPTRARTYRSVPYDPWQVREYILSNGIRLFVSVNRVQPRIFTHVAFRAGSKHDPPDTTGLAHYMEHMLFKGTRRIGALDWESESKLLDRISDLYERHRKTADAEEREALYRQIDQLSFEAAQLVAPNEYDQLASALGAQATNAYTWLEQTVYVNDIPANELDRWMKLESERFRYIALRLFHTELETVYEEFNYSQDQDFRKANQALRESLFPNHPYGTQTTLGHPSHLRNPSMKNIHTFFEKYYVPGNMAIVLAGDLDPDACFDLAERHFGDLAPRPVPAFTHDEQPAMRQPIRREVFGKEAPYLMMGWRCGPARTDDPLFIMLLEALMHNEQAGLLDINLNQRQKVLTSRSWSWTYEDYSAFGLVGRSREGQSLAEVESLLLRQVEQVREGAFSDALFEAVVNNLKLENILSGEKNSSRASAISQMFVLGVDWKRFVQRIDWMEKLDKETFVEWVGRMIRPDNYAIVYKLQGEDDSVVKVKKPPITPVQVNRGALSTFGKEFLSSPPARMQPRFADFQRSIHRHEMQKGLRLDYVRNPENSLFRLDFIFDFGQMADRHLVPALLYLPYLGTDKYSPQALQEAFFRLGLSYDVYCSQRKAYITLQGLDENLEEGLALLEHLLHRPRPDTAALRNLVSDIRMRREHQKQSRPFILRQALAQFGMYGEDSPFRNRLSADELQKLEAEDLIGRLTGLSGLEHQVYYFGPRDPVAIEQLIRREHRVPDMLKPPLRARAFPQLETSRDRVFLVDFPIVQADVLMLSRGTPHFSLEEHCFSKLYNDYFGSGLSSVVFQDIRESKALAYSTYVRYTTPPVGNESHYLQAYIGTQPDKLTDALPAMRDLIDNMPVVHSRINQARDAILRRLESESIPPRQLYWKARSTWDLGYGHDLRRELYRHAQQTGPEDLQDFHEQHVRRRAFSILILGQEDHLDMPFLESLGEITRLDPEALFGP